MTHFQNKVQELSSSKHWELNMSNYASNDYNY